MFLNLGLHTAASDTFNELERLARSRDPRVIYSMGTALATLGQDDLAIQRLENIPRHSRHYPRAQIMIARVEQRRGRVDQAEQRLKELAQEPRYTAAVVSELVDMKRRYPKMEDLIRWSDKALNVEGLPQDRKVQWLGIRAGLAVSDQNWLSALETIGQMSRLEPESMPLVAARIVLMLRLKQGEQARQLYRATPALASTPIGPLLAVSLHETPVDVPDMGPIPSFIVAMARSDLDAARAAVEAMRPHKTLYKDDLLTIINRPDATSKDMTRAFEILGSSLVALEYFQMPQLAEELTLAVIKVQPSLAPAYSLYVQALIDQLKPFDEALAMASKSLPASSLKLYLAARQATIDKDFDQAVAQFRSLVEREPGNYHTRYTLAQVLRDADDVEACIAELEQIYNQGETAYRILAANDLAYLLSLYQSDRLDEAHRIAAEALEAAPGVTALRDTVGWIEHLRGNNEAALAHLKQAVVGLPRLAEIHYHLGAVYKATGNTAWARYHLREAATSAEGGEGVDDAAKLLEELGA